MTSQDINLEHLKWAVQSRHANQICSLRLLTLLDRYEGRWKSKTLSRPAQALVSAAFSLWRAAFLAEKTGSRIDVVDDAKEFLTRIVEDNAISFSQDKISREWTFNYYTNNARASLEELRKKWKRQVPAYVRVNRTATERWDYCQELLSEAVNGFEKRLEEEKSDLVAAKQKKVARLERKNKRRKVRDFKKATRSPQSE